MKKKTNKQKKEALRLKAVPVEVGQDTMAGVIMIEIESLVQLLTEAKIIDGDKYKQLVITKVKEFIDSGVLAHSAGQSKPELPAGIPQESLDKDKDISYIG